MPCRCSLGHPGHPGSPLVQACRRGLPPQRRQSRTAQPVPVPRHALARSLACLLRSSQSVRPLPRPLAARHAQPCPTPGGRSQQRQQQQQGGRTPTTRDPAHDSLTGRVPARVRLCLCAPGQNMHLMSTVLGLAAYWTSWQEVRAGVGERRTFSHDCAPQEAPQRAVDCTVLRCPSHRPVYTSRPTLAAQTHTCVHTHLAPCAAVPVPSFLSNLSKP